MLERAGGTEERTAFFGGLLVVLPTLSRSCCIHKVLPALEMAVDQAIAVGETVILLHPPLPLVGASIGQERGCQYCESTGVSQVAERVRRAASVPADAEAARRGRGNA